MVMTMTRMKKERRTTTINTTTTTNVEYVAKHSRATPPSLWPQTALLSAKNRVST